MKLASIVFIGIVLLLLASCIKPPQSYSIIPNITLKSVSSYAIKSNDTVKFILNFTDGDGDLSQDPTIIPNCNVTDTAQIIYDSINHRWTTNPNAGACLSPTDPRNCLAKRDPAWSLFILDIKGTDTCVETKQLPQFNNPGKFKQLTGEIEFTSSILECRGAVAQDTFNFIIYIKDQAGHLSNALKVPPIFMQCH